ncbi:MAG: 50S ribosomal protein L32 [Bacteroidetes bacterium]|nr:50S ribosomal protein L32 [Bacteroidota bacterium]MCK6610446.1 50S ribosomal protein L32 [Bacteroidia bacterium]
MPNPKRKISNSRRDKRRTHYKGAAPSLTIDSASGEVHLRHRVTPNGYYKGKLAFPEMNKGI